MIERVHFHRFKQYRDESFDLRPSGISLLAGGNNSGKSTLLHGLAIWEFCKTVMVMEKSPEVLLAGAKHQGVGLGDEEFSPIAVPSLNHLWTNLRTQKDSTDADGYTLRIGTEWTGADDMPRFLTFGLSLANDRLFIKAISSNLESTDRLPQVAYLPPFAGIVDKEPKVSPAIRRRRIGEGVAGAVLRNLLLDMQESNTTERARLKGDRTKMRDSDLRNLRATDPWELLQETLRTIFRAELDVSPFREEYHSYIRVNLKRGTKVRYSIKRDKGSRDRDVMVEGSGFLQWLSVFALAFSPSVDTLLLDEPDAHLHPSLQTRMLESLSDTLPEKQVLLATHSVEMLRRSHPHHIVEIRGTKGYRYLSEEHQKVALLEGLGSDYAPHIDQVKLSHRVLFVEGRNDKDVLTALSKKLKIDFPGPWVIWLKSTEHRERKHLFLGLRDEIEELQAVSLRDRDDFNANHLEPDLTEKGTKVPEGFKALTWPRRTIENYLIDPAAIAQASGLGLTEVEDVLKEEFALSIGENFPSHQAPQAILDADGKKILKAFKVHPVDVAEALAEDRVSDDILAFFNHLGP
ncbi:MAG: AAA family ATPase [Chloroflexi bacterium]|nr:AAA family ATPase [Chloroflexota bacterium]